MSYQEAKEKYAALGIDAEGAMERLKAIPVSLHCWQGDDVRGFDTDPSKPLTGGIQTTGSYPGRARSPEELMADLDAALKLCPGTKKLNLHASYAIFEDGGWADRDKCIPLMDNGHYHPTEVVSDKIPALLAFFPEIALHVTRPIRWGSDHVVLFDDETKEICREIVRCGPERVNIALDYFDASINRVAAWAVGFRNLQKALLSALLQPNGRLQTLQDEGDFTQLMVLQEELKTAPFGEVWGEYCRRCGVPEDGGWFSAVRQYETDVLSKRG